MIKSSEYQQHLYRPYLAFYGKNDGIPFFKLLTVEYQQQMLSILQLLVVYIVDHSDISYYGIIFIPAGEKVDVFREPKGKVTQVISNVSQDNASTEKEPTRRILVFLSKKQY